MEIFVDLKENIKILTLKNGVKYFVLYERSDHKNLLDILKLANFSNKSDLIKFVRNQDGFFRFALWNNNFFFAAVDQVASKSILYKKQDNKLYVYFDTPNENKFNQASLKDILYSGYTLKNETIFKDIKSMLPGECIYLDNKKKKISNFKWYNFNPKYKVKIKERNFDEILNNIFNNIKLNNPNKNFLIPLSAGCDSRLVVSLMKSFGANFETFTYGFKGQRDFKIAEEICRKLDVKNHKIIMNTFNSRVYSQQKFKKFLNYKNFGISANNFGDFGPLSILDKKINKNEFMILNGQSGDFLTGGHLPTNVITTKNSFKKNKFLLFKFILKKHYTLWDNHEANCTSDYLERVNKYYFKNCKNYFDLLKSYEIYEFENRQSKWVIGQQKVYEFLGYTWDLPLWKTSIMKFFENNLVLNEKINQKYYKSFLIKKNYLDVWTSVPINPKLTFPLILYSIRLFFKTLFFFIGKNKWHIFQKRFFDYFLDPTGVIKILKYKNFIKLITIPRNSVSIVSKKYFDKYKN